MQLQPIREVDVVRLVNSQLLVWCSAAVTHYLSIASELLSFISNNHAQTLYRIAHGTCITLYRIAYGTCIIHKKMAKLNKNLTSGLLQYICHEYLSVTVYGNHGRG